MIDNDTLVWAPGDPSWQTYGKVFLGIDDDDESSSSSSGSGSDSDESSVSSYDLSDDEAVDPEDNMIYLQDPKGSDDIKCYPVNVLVNMALNGEINGDTSTFAIDSKHWEPLKAKTISHLILQEPADTNRMSFHTDIDFDHITDLTSLQHFDEAALLKHLERRFKQQEAYTSIGSILVVINPVSEHIIPDALHFYDMPDNLLPNGGKATRGLTTGTWHAKKVDNNLALPTPHPFALAEQSYQWMCFSESSQSIVMLGENGSGKSEVAKLALAYLAERAHDINDLKGIDSIDTEVALMYIPKIMESLGHAKTSMNENSTRYGSITKLYYRFDKDDQNIPNLPYWSNANLVGGVFTTHLFEKSRLTLFHHDERTFHVFYELLQEVKRFPDKYEYLYLGEITDYKLLLGIHNHGDVFEDPLEADEFDGFLGALHDIGYNDNQIHTITVILGGILHMGNIAFETKSDGSIEMFDSTNISGTLAASYVLNIDYNALKTALTTKSVVVGKREVSAMLSKAECYLTRDLFIKFIYSALVQTIIHKLNVLMAPPEEYLRARDTACINIVDFGGYENFTSNNLEQLCANYASECLQDFYNSVVIEKEFELLKAEGMSTRISPFRCHTNGYDSTIQHFHEIFLALDSVSKRQGATGETYVNELSALSQGHRLGHLLIGFKKTQKLKTLFKIRHTSGNVIYTCVDYDDVKGTVSWVDKNLEFFPDALAAVINASSKNSYLQTILPALNGLKREHKTVAAQCIQATSTICRAEMGKTQCHFALCIKPCRSMTEDVFNRVYVAEQMRSLSLLQTCEISRFHHTLCIPYAEIKEALSEILQSQPIVRTFYKVDEKTFISCILHARGFKVDDYTLGHNRAFFRPTQLRALDKTLNGAADRVYSEKEIFDEALKIVQAYESLQAAKSRINDLENRFKATKHALHASSALVKEMSAEGVKLDIKSKALKIPHDTSLLVDIAIKRLNEINGSRAYIWELIQKTQTAVTEQMGHLRANGTDSTVQDILTRANAEYLEVKDNIETNQAKYSDLQSKVKSAMEYEEAVKKFREALSVHATMVDDSLKELVELKDAMADARISVSKWKFEIMREQASEMERTFDATLVKVNGAEKIIRDEYSKVIAFPTTILDENYEAVRQAAVVVLRSFDQTTDAIEAIRRKLNSINDYILRKVFIPDEVHGPPPPPEVEENGKHKGKGGVDDDSIDDEHTGSKSKSSKHKSLELMTKMHLANLRLKNARLDVSSLMASESVTRSEEKSLSSSSSSSSSTSISVTSSSKVRRLSFRTDNLADYVTQVEQMLIDTRDMMSSTEEKVGGAFDQTFPKVPSSDGRKTLRLYSLLKLWPQIAAACARADKQISELSSSIDDLDSLSKKKLKQVDTKFLSLKAEVTTLGHKAALINGFEESVKEFRIVLMEQQRVVNKAADLLKEGREGLAAGEGKGPNGVSNLKHVESVLTHASTMLEAVSICVEDAANAVAFIDDKEESFVESTWASCDTLMESLNEVLTICASIKSEKHMETSASNGKAHSTAMGDGLKAANEPNGNHHNADDDVKHESKQKHLMKALKRLPKSIRSAPGDHEHGHNTASALPPPPPPPSISTKKSMSSQKKESSDNLEVHKKFLDVHSSLKERHAAAAAARAAMEEEEKEVEEVAFESSNGKHNEFNVHSNAWHKKSMHVLMGAQKKKGEDLEKGRAASRRQAAPLPPSLPPNPVDRESEISRESEFNRISVGNFVSAAPEIHYVRKKSAASSESVITPALARMSLKESIAPEETEETVVTPIEKTVKVILHAPMKIEKPIETLPTNDKDKDNGGNDAAGTENDEDLGRETISDLRDSMISIDENGTKRRGKRAPPPPPPIKGDAPPPEAKATCSSSSP